MTWIRHPRQSRSRRTSDAIIAAALALLEEKPFHEITVADVARKAHVSVGGFYARFRDKEALLDLLDERVLEDALAAFDDALSDAKVARATIATIVTRYVEVMVRKFREHRGAIQQMRRGASTGTNPGFAERARAFNAHVHGRFRVLLQARRSQIQHPDPDLAINMALFIASAAAREAILAGSLRAYPVTVDDTQLIREISRSALAYLGAKPGRHA